MSGSEGKEGLDLAFVGDINLGGSIGEQVGRHGPTHPWGRVASALDGADTVIGNLECCVAADEVIEETGKPAMIAARSHLAALPGAGVGVVSLANNHAMDAGPEGITEAMGGLAEQGVRCVGAGQDVAAASAIRGIEVGGYRLGLVAACDQSAHWAGRARPGVAPLSWGRLAARVREARRRFDVVIVLLHADYEFMSTPSPGRIRGARRLAAAGADLVIQHHPHVLQGIETHRGGLIAYSLGNFLFQVAGNSYQERRPGTRDSVVLRVQIRPGAGEPPRWQAIPVTLTDTGHPALPEGEAVARIRRELATRSALLGDPTAIRRNWRQACRWENGQLYYSLARAVEGRKWKALIRSGWLSLARPDQRRGLVGWATGGWL
jgi:poly-gamma-glutamate synthesis protein (capsule biosynthesis protein)